MTILLVDPDIDQIDTLKRILNINGYEVESCFGGNDAIDMIKNNISESYETIIAECILKDMSGIEFLKLLREHNISIPVLLSGTYSNKRMILDELKNQNEKYLEKPFSITELLFNIESAKGKLKSFNV